MEKCDELMARIKATPQEQAADGELYRELSDDLVRDLKQALYCPECARADDLVKMRYEGGDSYFKAGHVCPQCEEGFVPAEDGYDHDDYGGVLGADGRVYSDALTGF